MAKTTPKDSTGGAITFSRGAQATAEGVANAANNGIINNVQTSGGKAVKGSTKGGRDVSGMSVAELSDPNETANVLKEVGEFNAMPNPMLPGQTQATPTTPYQSKSFTQANPNDPTLTNDRGEQVSYDQYIAQGGRADFSNVQKAFQQATGAAPQEAGAARTAMDQMLPQTPPTTPPQVENFLQTSPIMQSSIQELQEFLSPESTSKMLADSMKQIVKSNKEAAALKFELMDVDRVMAGTEQDIRDEIEATGGFGTESQVQALTIGRNKTLLQKAAMIQNKLNYMQDVIQSDMMMYGFQKDMAQQEFQKRSFLLQFKQENDRFIYQANQDALNRQLTMMGPDGMYNATGGDPVKIERLERMMGLQPGGLKTAADMAAQAKAQAQAQQDLENRQRQQQINISGGQLALGRAELAYRKEKDTADRAAQYLKDNPPPTPMGMAASKSNIDQINNLVIRSDKENAVGSSWLSRLNLKPGVKGNFIADVEQVVSQLTMDNLINAKARGATFGALSEGELNLLASSASKINTWAVKKDGVVVGYKTSVQEFNKELDKINNFAKMDYILKGGDPAAVGVQVMPNGDYVTKNSDGSFIKF